MKSPHFKATLHRLRLKCREAGDPAVTAHAVIVPPITPQYCPLFQRFTLASELDGAASEPVLPEATRQARRRSLQQNQLRPLPLNTPFWLESNQGSLCLLSSPCHT